MGLRSRRILIWTEGSGGMGDDYYLCIDFDGRSLALRG